MEAGTDLQERADASPDVGMAVGRLRNAGEDFEQRALPCPVAADDTDHFSALNLERDVFQCPDVGLLAPGAVIRGMPQSGPQAAKGRSEGVRDDITERLVRLPFPDPVLLCESLATNGYITHWFR